KNKKNQRKKRDLKKIPALETCCQVGLARNQTKMILMLNLIKTVQKRDLKRRLEKTRKEMLQQKQNTKNNSDESEDEEDFPDQSILDDEVIEDQGDVELTAQKPQSVPTYYVKDQHGNYLEIDADT
ncbi:hypothetical protein RFI_16973, partial [Reticulomyxa filosa]